eukprot:g38003.t1
MKYALTGDEVNDTVHIDLDTGKITDFTKFDTGLNRTCFHEILRHCILDLSHLQLTISKQKKPKDCRCWKSERETEIAGKTQQVQQHLWRESRVDILGPVNSSSELTVARK